MDKSGGAGTQYCSDEGGEFSLPDGVDLVGVGDNGRNKAAYYQQSGPAGSSSTSRRRPHSPHHHPHSNSSSRGGHHHQPPSWKTALKLVIVNMFVCSLVLGYALVGSFVFLALENNPRGGVGSSVLASTSGGGVNSGGAGGGGSLIKRNLTTAIMNSLQNEAIQQLKSDTVRNIWDITLSMNILYPDNWTKMTNEEVGNFQRFLLDKVITAVENATGQETYVYPWTFPRAFLFALTTLTTIGYGGIGPKTSSGKVATMVYAVFGIPIMLWYLSNVGSLLAKIVRFFCLKVCGCCFCRDVSSPSSSSSSSASTRKVDPYYNMKPIVDTSEMHHHHHNHTSDDATNSSRHHHTHSQHRISICFIFTLCILVLLGYVCLGAWVVTRWEKWRFLDSFYFCFLTLTTISFGDSRSQRTGRLDSFTATTEWFCSFYILFGMALTSMFFNILHEEISQRFKQWKQHSPSSGDKRIPVENSYSVHFMNFSGPNQTGRNFTEETLLSNSSEVHRGLANPDSPKGGGGGGGGVGYDDDTGGDNNAFMSHGMVPREIYGPPHTQGNVFPR